MAASRFYEVRTDTGKVYEIAATDPVEACQRIADLHQVTVVAHRPSQRPRIVVGCQTTD